AAPRNPPRPKKVRAALEPMRPFGYELPSELLLGDDLHAFEPALSDRVGAGFYVQQQWHVRADTFTNGLPQQLRDLAQWSGAEGARPRRRGDRGGRGAPLRAVGRPRDGSRDLARRLHRR